jgi:solute carrier family 8 (sodium/calcium exchanger)
LAKIENEEEQTWKSQFISACMLHPTKNEDGEITDIAFMEGFLHFTCIGWKLLFSFIPPPHYGGGWPCFGISLCFIGAVTFVVGEIANVFGCVLNIPPPITAITFVALGTSLPDTFASMIAASQEKYADSAIGNVTGSNSVNVFLGLGLPWVIATIWESTTETSEKGYIAGFYYVPAATLGFSVIVFCVVAVIGILIFIIRRQVVGGELGGKQFGRTLSASILVGLWLIYIIMSILQSFNIGGIGD